MRCAHPSLVVATLTVLACSSGERRHAGSAADSVFTPRQYSVADFYRNTSYFGASFSPKADRILVSSNASGVYNAYAIPTAGGAPEALTKSADDAVFAVSWFPSDDRVLYSSDRGGNELDHLYVRLPDGSTKDLTPGEKHKAQFAEWSNLLRTGVFPRPDLPRQALRLGRFGARRVIAQQAAEDHPGAEEGEPREQRVRPVDECVEQQPTRRAGRRVSEPSC